MAVLGVDGDLATTGAGTPAAGRVQAKIGPRIDLAFRSFDEFFAARQDEGAIAAAIQAAY